MPASERAFSEPPPESAYLDSDFLIILFVPTHLLHAQAQGFARRLIGAGTVAHVSSLVWIEFAHVTTRAAFRDDLPAALRRRFRLDAWDDAQVRQEYLRAGLGALDELLDQFVEWVELPTDEAVRRQALTYIGEYNLGAQDAVHLASARLAGLNDLVSFDRGYRRVDGLTLWNDRIFG